MLCTSEKYLVTINGDLWPVILLLLKDTPPWNKPLTGRQAWAKDKRQPSYHHDMIWYRMIQNKADTLTVSPSPRMRMRMRTQVAIIEDYVSFLLYHHSFFITYYDSTTGTGTGPGRLGMEMEMEMEMGPIWQWPSWIIKCQLKFRLNSQKCSGVQPPNAKVLKS